MLTSRGIGSALLIVIVGSAASAPSVRADGVSDAKAAILAAHAAHPADLAHSLEVDQALRSDYIEAHVALSQAVASGPHPDVAGFYLDLMGNRLGVEGFAYFRRARVFDPESENLMAVLRERAYRTLKDALPPTAEHRRQMAETAAFTGVRRVLLEEHAVLVMDNTSLSARQLDIVLELMRVVPAQIHDLAAIGVVDLFGGLPPDVAWWDFFGGAGGEVNILSIAPGTQALNQFPSDVPAGPGDTFTMALAHELNHIVDAFLAGPGQIPTRNLELVARAGCDQLNYLRSTLPQCFFVQASVEFFASIANQWFANSSRALDLALLRFDAGRPEPLNQFLYFAEQYVVDGESTYFYESDEAGKVVRHRVPVEIDADGRVRSLVHGGKLYEFDLDANGFVLDVRRLDAGCPSDGYTLCLGGGRFRVETAWRTPAGHSGFGRAASLTADTGYFWFFDPANVELVVKALDGCGVNQRFWVFAGGLTNVSVEIRVVDTVSGATRVYRNPQGQAFVPLQDTAAFASCQPNPSAHVAEPSAPGLAVEVHEKDGSACGGADDDLCLRDGRFRVEVDWTTPDGATGAGRGVAITSDTGYFWFFDDRNVEMLVKALDACGLNSQFWIFGGGLTNVEVTMRVIDTRTGVAKTYSNPQATAFQPVQDTSAFSTCP